MYILYQFNEKYAPYAGVSMTSLLYNNKAAEFIYIYVLGEGLSEASVDKLTRLVMSYGRKIIFVDTTELVDKMKKLNMPTYRGSYAANMRLFVSEIVGLGDEDDSAKNAGEGNRLLYLDADTIVTGDLRDFYNSEIKTVGMVYDVLGCDHKYSIGLGTEDGYYNSGVILYDLDKWRQNDYTGKIIDHVINVRAQYPSPDQDLLNVVLAGDITALPFEYNFQPHFEVYDYDKFMKLYNPYPFYTKAEAEMAKHKPMIIHAYRYIGEFCWHRGNVHPFNDVFDKYLAMSTFDDYVKEPSDGGLTIKIEKIMYKVLPKSIFIRIFKIIHSRFYRKADEMSKDNKINEQM